MPDFEVSGLIAQPGEKASGYLGEVMLGDGSRHTNAADPSGSGSRPERSFTLARSSPRSRISGAQRWKN